MSARPSFASLFALSALLLAGRAEAAPAASRLGPAKPPTPAPVLLTSILGVTTGMDRDAAEAKMKPLGRLAGDADADKESAPDKESGADKHADRDKDAAASAGGGDPDAIPVEVWTLRGTPYARVAFAADDHDRLLWVTGFLRPGQEVPFAKIGDPARAAGRAGDRVVWNVISPHGSYRVRAVGRGGRAGSVSLIAIRPVSPNGIFSPAIVPKPMKGKPR